METQQRILTLESNLDSSMYTNFKYSLFGSNFQALSKL